MAGGADTGWLEEMLTAAPFDIITERQWQNGAIRFHAFGSYPTTVSSVEFEALPCG